MENFFRFPHTPHLKWLAPGTPRGDKILDAADIKNLLDHRVTIEEKVDGANLGFSISPNGELRAQNRGQYLSSPFTGQFSRLPGWLAQHGPAIEKVLSPQQIVFGEWCAAKHSLDYFKLPDWYLVFDIFDRKEDRFLSSIRRNELAHEMGLHTVPCLFSGMTTMAEIEKTLLVQRSKYREGVVEGLVIRRDSNDWCEERAKLVHPDFIQSLEEHWRKRPIEWNRVKR